MPDESPGQTGAVVDPARAYNFKCVIDKVTQALFTRCSGLGVKVDVVCWREAGEHAITRCLPGQVEYRYVTLSYGVTQTDEMWQWLQKAVMGKADRRNMSIVLLDSEGAGPVLQWNLLRAWVCELRCPVLDALSREVAIEHMTLVCEKIELG